MRFLGRLFLNCYDLGGRRLFLAELDFVDFVCVEDVRKYYMDQVPMRKGTGPEDVTKAVLYLIEQTCETGQAVPVTGGQVMLS